MSGLLSGEINGQAFVSAVAGPAAFFALALLWNALRAPSQLERRQRGVIAELETAIHHLQAEKRVMQQELEPAISLESANTAEYERELDIPTVQNDGVHEIRRERHKVKLVKVTNLSSQSLVVNAQITEVDPPIVEGLGPPIRLAWRESSWGNHTLSAHEFDYLIVSPAIPDVELWARAYARTIRVSVWVAGQLGVTRRFRLDNLQKPSLYPWIVALDGSSEDLAESR